MTSDPVCRLDCPCPVCETFGVYLPESSRYPSKVDYYRCPACAHVWTVPRNECEPTRDVTPRKE